MVPRGDVSRMVELHRGSTTYSPGGIKGELDKIRFLRGMGVDGLDVSVVPEAERDHAEGFAFGRVDLADVGEPFYGRGRPASSYSRRACSTWSRFAVAQRDNVANSGPRLRPSALISYSTRGGTSA